MHPETLDFDTIVVGAGIVGSGCAYKIAESGRRTLLLEQFSLGHVHGSSHGASRIIRCTHSDPTFLPFVLDAFQEWDKLRQIDGPGDPLVIKNGMLTMDVDWAQTRIRASVLSRFGVRHEVLRGGAAIQKRFPQLVDYDEGWSAVYEPGGGSMLAENCLKAVQRQFLAQGKTRATLKAEEPVLDIVSREAPATEAHHPDEHPLPATAFVEVTTSKGKYTAQNVVVAVGGWLPRLLPGLPLKTSPHVIGVNFWRVKSRPELFRPESGFPTLVISDEHGQELFALPCIDYPDAVKFAIHMGMPVEDLDQKMAQQLPDWMLLIPARHIAKHLPDLDCSEPLIRSTCVYTMTDDLNFIVDQHPRHANIFIAGGFSGTGFKYALTFGKIMAKWVNGRPETEFDMSAFRLDRKIDQQLQRARL